MNIRKRVIVVFKYEGVTYPTDILPGVLLENGQVFINRDRASVYDAEVLPCGDCVLVDLDTNGKEYLKGEAALLSLVAGELY